MKSICTAIILLILFAGTSVFAQYPMQSMNTLERFLTRSGDYVENLEAGETIKGSPYTNDAFSMGQVSLDGIWYDSVNMRYNAYDSEFEVKMEDGMYAIRSDVQAVDTVRYNDELFVRKNLNPAGNVRLDFMVLLAEGSNFSLCKQYVIRFNMAEPAGGYSDAKPAEYKSNPPRYYIFKGNDIHEIKGNASLAEAFSTDTKSIRSYLKKNKYKLNREEDLVETVVYFSSSVN